MAKIIVKEFIESLKEMTILEIKEVVEAMKEEFGIDPSAMAAAPAAAVEEVDEGPKEVDVMLKEVGPSKVKVIKVIREVTGLGLIDAKKLVDSAPVVVKEKISEDAGKELQEKLQTAGATVELK
ncbi:MAG: 50S ribosomal protein L7/L12 [Tenericutes bacterium]|nr:50S ribosomal protein L7/L12 [Mycoplasmatota bacterium]